MANQTAQLVSLLESRGLSVVQIPTNAPLKPALIEGIRYLRALVRLPLHLYRLLTKIRNVDVVHVMANSGLSWHLLAVPAIWVAFLQKRPIVVNYRGGDARRFFAKSAWSVKFSLARCSAVVVPSQFLADVFSEIGVSVKIIPNIVDVDRFCPIDDIRFEESLSRSPKIIMARNLEKIYAIDVGIRAFSEVLNVHPSAQLLIAGAGPEVHALKDLVRSTGLSDYVTFLGQLENAKMASMYRSCHIMLNSSSVDNMPISLLEAMAAGLPIVSTSAGGIPYVVDDRENGILVEIGDTKALADGIVGVLSDATLRRTLRAKGREKAKLYSCGAITEQWAKLYDKCGQSGSVQCA